MPAFSNSTSRSAAMVAVMSRPEDVDGDLIADDKADFHGLLGGEGHQRGAVIVVGPPRTIDDFVLWRRACHVGHATVALDDPVIARDIGRPLAVDPAENAAQHRGGIDTADGGIVFDAIKERVQLVGLDIHEESRRARLAAGPAGSPRAGWRRSGRQLPARRGRGPATAPQTLHPSPGRQRLQAQCEALCAPGPNGCARRAGTARGCRGLRGPGGGVSRRSPPPCLARVAGCQTG
jgi:hypothetical protein